MTALTLDAGRAGRVSIELPAGHDLVTHRGDAMRDTLRPGAVLVVDRGDRLPSPPGLFLLDRKIGEEVRRVEVIPNSRPLRARVSTDHDAFPAYEIPVDQLQIAGRVVGSFLQL